MVANGYGSTILPDLALPVEAGTHSRLRVVRFQAPVPVRTIGLAWRSSSPREPDSVEFHRFVIAARSTAERPASAFAAELAPVLSGA
jgi:LysR family hydrogen peroxide-inducible transcriptional activator